MRDTGWCRVCGSRHPGADCPGYLETTGPERVGWRVTVDTPDSVEAYGVLVAPVGKRWRARILTFPKSLWTIPEGAGTMKFLAATPQQAERLAIDFIEAHCTRRGYVLRNQLEPVSISGLGTTGVMATPAHRRMHTDPVRFGPRAPTARGLTHNLSETGVFVMTGAPLEAGLDVYLRIETSRSPVDLRGSVVWRRGAPEMGRPAGMGIRLVQPPPTYLAYVRSLGG